MTQTNFVGIDYGSKLSNIKSISDEVIYHPGTYKVLFGSKAQDPLKAKFKVVKNPDLTINDNDLKVQVISAINSFFEISNWDFGDRFYLGELTTFILNAVAPNISNIAIVPRTSNQRFGSLFEIQSSPNEILVSGATVDDVEIVQNISVIEINTTNKLV
jgi:hypothetical protein